MTRSRSRSLKRLSRRNDTEAVSEDVEESDGPPRHDACAPCAERFLHDLQQPEHVQPGLASRPWHDPDAFPWCADLERHFEQIRAELMTVLDNEEAWPLVRGQHGLTRGDGEWREIVMLGEGSELGRRLCPTTAKVLDGIPAAKHLADSSGACGNAMFSKLTPGARLHPHCGPTNTRLTCHFGIEVPPGCGMRVGSETRQWRAGECLVFDDSWEHEVWNGGSRSRVVLLVNFWHPDLPREQWDDIAEELRDGFID